VLRCHGDSYLGARANNEDAFGWTQPPDPAARATVGCLYVVCDGMGGHAAGEVASRVATQTCRAAYYHDDRGSDPPQRLAAAVAAANRAILAAAEAEAERRGMGSTLVALLVIGERAWVAHVGDSRAYHLRDGRLTLLTQDHLLVTAMLGLTGEAAKAHRQGHVLSRALGVAPEMPVDVTSVPWREGDRVLLCTDGLSGALMDSELAACLAAGEPKEVVAALMARARKFEADDNSTAVVVAWLPEA
jgi:protein phosphatase